MIVYNKSMNENVSHIKNIYINLKYEIYSALKYWVFGPNDAG